MLIQTRQFPAVDAAGLVRTVYVYRDVPFAAWSGPGDGPRGPDQLRDAAWRVVVRVGRGEYRVEETGEVLTTAAPDAS